MSTGHKRVFETTLHQRKITAKEPKRLLISKQSFPAIEIHELRLTSKRQKI